MSRPNAVYGLADITSSLLRPCRESRLRTSLDFLLNFPRTCFWAGDIFTPKLLVKNKHDQEVPIQQFLQNSFLDMWEMVVRAVGDLDGVIGFQVSIIHL